MKLAAFLVMAVLHLGSPASAQIPPANPDPIPVLFEAWVDPVHGQDPTQLTQSINDRYAPYRTLQAAIDGMHLYLGLVWDHDQNPNVQGLVYALPGLYGPHGEYSSGDDFPITMRDRVHVQGLGAGRCIIRGGSGVQLSQISFPSLPCTHPAQTQLREVLVDFTDAITGASSPTMTTAPPWHMYAANHSLAFNDTPEKLDGFTLQGGDVQVYFGTQLFGHQRMHGIISNCVFDMRHNLEVHYYAGSPPTAHSQTLSGPYFGAAFAKVFRGGYVDHRVVIANNTFVLAEYGPTGSPDGGWVRGSRPEACAIIDYTIPNCNNAPNIWADPDQRPKGLGNMSILNNVFRTQPIAGTGLQAMAMIGIDAGDTLINPGSGPLVQTNVFASSRVGAQSLGSSPAFYSLPVVSQQMDPLGSILEELFYVYCQGLPHPGAMFVQCNANCALSPCTVAPLPTPALELWDSGSVGNDPIFVGEFLNRKVIGIVDYVDWRLLPPSPLKDLGWVPTDEEFAIFNGNGVKFKLPKHTKLQMFKWDGEHYGNPRVVDGYPDVGFDEIHLMIMTGSYGPYSTSHNVPGEFSPVAAPGLPFRTVIVPEGPNQQLVVGKEFKVMGVGEAATQDPPPAWEQPPKTLASPILMAGLPRNYNERYISFAAPHPPTPWTGLFHNNILESYDPPGSTGTVSFYRISIADNECASGQCSHLYFNTQLLILDAAHSPILVGNLQSEYR